MYMRILSIYILVTIWCSLECRSDPAEGSRLLEEVFRDYDKRIRPNFGGSPVAVNVSIHILSLPEIDTGSMTFKLSFFIRQMWIDPRFFFNSRRNIDTIMLDASTSERIWSPDTFFVNELSSVSHDILVKNQFCRISQNGTVLLSRRVTLTAFANMDSSLFPYDSHNLILNLESYGSQTKDMKYQWAESSVTAGFLNTPGYSIGNIEATDTSLTTSTGSYSRLTLTISAKRKALLYELGFMLPTGLLALLCWGSMYIKNATLGTLTSIWLVSLMTLMNGLLLLTNTGSNIMNNIPCLTPLQLYSLLSSGLGLACLIVNVRNERKSTHGNGSESKSRTESSSENCQTDHHLPYGATMHDNDGNNQCVTQAEQTRFKFMKCRPKLRAESCVCCSLLAVLTAMNIVFFLVFRLLP